MNSLVQHNGYVCSVDIRDVGEFTLHVSHAVRIPVEA